MSERGWIEPIVERVVGEVLDGHVAQLRSEIVRRVMEEIASQPGASGAAGKGGSSAAPAELAKSVAEIHGGSSQREILRALLDCSAKYAARVALFVVKGSHASGWQARGFGNSEGIKDFALDGHSGAVSSAIADRVSASVAAGQFDAKFMKEFGAPASGEGHLLPLILKDKVAALVYADGGNASSGGMDAGAVELLVLATSAWLEVNTLRKQSHKETGPAEPQAAAPEAQAAAAAQSVPAFNDPFAAHAPAFSTGKAKAAAASAGGGTVSAVDVAQAGAEVQSAAVEAEPAETAGAPIPAEDQDVHRKAQRFARLLVDEIKLYNQAKVAEGRKNKDLYDRLKEAIEKSRATYQKRYGNTAAASGDYFQHEIIRSLAEDDPSIMGANFRH